MSEKVKHTPGPFGVIGGGIEGDEPGRMCVTAVRGNKLYFIAEIQNGVPGDTCKTEMANAYLFAAAPDLLASCEELCRRLEVNELVNRPADPCNQYDQPAYDRARAAIAKATKGVTP